jgi:hypothetical protein
VLAEVPDLRVVDVRAELGVDTDQPPALRQLHHEVAAGLHRAPRAERAALREEPQERGEPVVPVVVAGQCHEHRRRVHRAGPERRAVGPLHPVLVAGRGRRRVDLVAAENQQPAARQPQRIRLDAGRRRHREVVGGEQPGHGVRGVEAVAEIRDVVEPQAAVGVRNQGQDGRRERRLYLAPVRVVGEERREADLDRRPEQLAGREPPHLVRRGETQRPGVLTEAADVHVPIVRRGTDTRPPDG